MPLIATHKYRIFIYGALLAMTLFVPAALAGTPVKLAVSSDRSSVWTGQTPHLEVKLLDANNRPVDSPKRWELSIDITAPDGSVTTRPLVMEPGDHSKTIQLPVDKAGVWKVVAKDKQLMEAAAVLNAMTQPTQRAGDDGLSVEQLLRSRQRVIPQVELRVTPQRTLLADGRDSATVYGLLSGNDAIATTDIKLRLHNSDGTLQPAELTILKGEFSGTAQLISDHPGNVAVEYLGAVPAAKLIGKDSLSVKFGPPITGIEIKASPPQISLLESAEVVVRLLGNDNVPLATDQPRDIFLTIEQGSGQLGTHQFNIPAGSAEGRASFTPTTVGNVVLAAASPNLVTTQVPLQVTWPITLLITSAIGGLVGGLLAFAMEKGARWWRSAIGLVTGFVLYWAVIFIGINDLAGGYAINPLSALAISVIGGWAGTQVFTPLLKRLGVAA